MEETRVPCKFTYASEEKRVVHFDAKDSRGRQIGAVIRTGMVIIEKKQRETFGSMVCKPSDLGIWFYFTPGAARDGQDYGATQREQRFASADERAKAIEKYLNAAAKRAAKAAAK